MAPPEGNTANEPLVSSSKMSKSNDQSASATKTTTAKTPASSSTNPDHPDWYAKRKVHEKSLEDQANCVSEWFLQYLSPLLKLGSTKVLVLDDIGAPSEQDRASRAFKLMGDAWQVQCDKAKALNEKRRAKYDAKLAKMSEEQGEESHKSSNGRKPIYIRRHFGFSEIC